MKIRSLQIFSVVLGLVPASAFAAGTFIVPAVSVGNNLEVESRIALSEAAPKGGLTVQVASSDPSRLLMSLHAEQKGAASISVQIAEGQRSSPEFFFHGLADADTVTYTASAPGFDTGAGKVTLTPSGLVVKGPGSLGTPIRATPRAWAARIMVYAAQFSAEGEFIDSQRVRGGFPVALKIRSSNPHVATAVQPELTIDGGEFAVATELKNIGVGFTELTAEAPGFRTGGAIQKLAVELHMPSISLLDEMHLGNNMQINTAITLGEPAPPEGVEVTLTSKDPSRLLLAAGPYDKGAPSIKIKVPAGATAAPYSVHGMAGEGSAQYVASAPGFREREATLPLVPSGIIITGPTGLPDEAEVLRPEIPLAPNGFNGKVGDTRPIGVTIYTVRLDPKTHRAADITVQLLRADLTLKVDLRTDNPAVGHLPPSVTIKGGEGQATVVFTPKAPGKANLSFDTPAGYTRPTNATELMAVISE